MTEKQRITNKSKIISGLLTKFIGGAIFKVL